MTTRTFVSVFGVVLALLPTTKSAAQVQQGELAGYLLVPNSRVDSSFNAGFSMYVAAWPLLKSYPGSQFQSGLPGTWMFAQFDSTPANKHYSDIEGGLGWWHDTRFATETPKFIMGGVAPDFREWANGPGAGKGRDWSKPNGKYGIAQLSPWLLWPPDGLNLKQGTSGELFGYGYLPLPLSAAKAKTAGAKVPTGDQSWTLFLNTGNFKGPVTFFTPYFWSRGAVEDPKFTGMLLDSRPSNPNRAVQMETQHIPSAQAVDSKGVTYARIAPTQFPAGDNGESLVLHQITSYNRKALWDSVKSWFDGGKPASGAIDPEGEAHHEFNGRGGATWKTYANSTAKEQRMPLAWSSFSTPFAPDKSTYGFRWNSPLAKKIDTKNGSLIMLPEYYRLEKRDNNKSEWVPVAADVVPAETGLASIPFDRAREDNPQPYVTPDDPQSSWKKPGPKAGPFQAKLGDGSTVTYYWYRFCEQPALLNADMTDQERQALQTRVEKLHRQWTKNRTYLAPPKVGKLADLDPALVVKPPRGMEVGYVPIVTRQELKR
ncbi:MAG: hypothetical protein ABJA67_02795 [Chthonomonadales bacterium]